MIKPAFNPATEIPLMEKFYSIQGEGFHQGTAAYFIRLAGCDVGCVWCDVKESWEVSPEQVTSISDIVNKAIEFSSPVTIITGGEPLIYNLDSLTHSLKTKDKKVHLETSGAYPLSGTWDWICISPKKFKPPLDEVLRAAHELKVVVFNKSDFKWAESFKEKVNAACKLFLQPEWSKEKEMMPLLIDYVKTNPEWNISLQIHKYLQIP
jgi:7-carboxy-7-deazaguanine synthase